MFVWSTGHQDNDGRISLWGEIEWKRLEARMRKLYRFRIARRRAFTALREWCRFLAPHLIAGAKVAGGVTVCVAYLLLAWLLLLAYGD